MISSQEVTQPKKSWRSQKNDPGPLKQIPDSFLKSDDGGDITKTLAVAWDAISDILLFSTSSMKAVLKSSKRSGMCALARFYDLGLICPGTYTRSADDVICNISLSLTQKQFN